VAGEAGGLPLSVVVSAANANDSTMLEAVLEDIPPIRMPTGRRRQRPGKVHADKAYDHRRCRAYLRRRGIRPRIARRTPARSSSATATSAGSRSTSPRGS
jgi:IS5 family transposase